MLEENSDLHLLDPEGRFRRIAEMRHKCRMAAIETDANAKIRKSLIGRSRPIRRNYVPGDLVYSWRAGNGVYQAQGQWLGPARVEVSERKYSSDQKLFRKAKELELQSWLDHRVFDLVKTKFVDQESPAREVGTDMEVDWTGKSTSVCVGLSGSRSDRGAQ